MSQYIKEVLEDFTLSYDEVGGVKIPRSFEIGYFSLRFSSKDGALVVRASAYWGEDLKLEYDFDSSSERVKKISFSGDKDHKYYWEILFNEDGSIKRIYRESSKNWGQIDFYENGIPSKVMHTQRPGVGNVELEFEIRQYFLREDGTKKEKRKWHMPRDELHTRFDGMQERYVGRLQYINFFDEEERALLVVNFDHHGRIKVKETKRELPDPDVLMSPPLEPTGETVDEIAKRVGGYGSKHFIGALFAARGAGWEPRAPNERVEDIYFYSKGSNPLRLYYKDDGKGGVEVEVRRFVEKSGDSLVTYPVAEVVSPRAAAKFVEDHIGKANTSRIPGLITTFREMGR